MDLQIFSLMLSQLSYFGLFGVNVQGENVPFDQTTNRKKVVTECFSIFIRAFIAFDGEFCSHWGISSNGRVRA